STLEARGVGICTGGTDTHLILIDLKTKGLLGAQAESILESANIICNKNSIPFDPISPKKWTGLRLGTAAGTTRGMDAETFTQVGNLIADLLDSASETGEPDLAVLEKVKKSVLEICKEHPTYS
ncbi:MAG TPA: serine hydroxymethyltransferase, partial [Anaerolineales bacterium]|nr:serine hydroxymethyltransferase [Anaerolineales bacterium]